ncbi:hypothetical protein K490DRAFT_54565 [Saccharata proteae CBS 121410]|uniref:Uncharacterized protein n=1 Tax=Saccharata proteae CBS 121410 TaxID=1314787 RepID=A0A9P4LYC9_9PEZI|nr:hypothetical protein K490DRAFT_54565 [Saccharata proteae CBS 121410]
MRSRSPTASHALLTQRPLPKTVVLSSNDQLNVHPARACFEPDTPTPARARMPPTNDLRSSPDKPNASGTSMEPPTPTPTPNARRPARPRDDFTSSPRSHRQIFHSVSALHQNPPTGTEPAPPSAVHEHAHLAVTPPTMEVPDFNKKLPCLFDWLYNQEVLKVKHGHSEDNLNQALEAKAKALGIDTAQLQPPASIDDGSVAALSFARRDSTSGDTQASGCSYDFNTPPSPSSFDHRDHSALPWLDTRSTSPAPTVPYARSPPFQTPIKKSLKERLKLVLAKAPPTSRDSISPRSSFSDQSRPHFSSRSFKRTRGKALYDLPSGPENSTGSIPDSWTDTLLKTTVSRPSSSDSSLARRSRRPEYQAAWKLSMENAQFREIWDEHSRTWYRIAAFEVKQRKLMNFYIEFSKKRLGEQCNRLRELQEAEQTRDLERLEEKQLNAEMSLLKSQEDESRQAAQALGYMRAYCDNALGPQAGRVITEEDRNRLRAQELHATELARKHESALKMLRARQEVGVKQRKDTHKVWRRQLAEVTKAAWEKLDRIANDLRNNRLPTLIHERRRRALTRYYICLAIWDKELGSEADTPDLKHLFDVPWPEVEKAEALAGGTSSMLDTYHQVTYDLPPIVNLTHNGIFAAPTSANLPVENAPVSTPNSANFPAAKQPVAKIPVAARSQTFNTRSDSPTPSETPPKRAAWRWSTLSHLRGSTSDWCEPEEPLSFEDMIMGDRAPNSGSNTTTATTAEVAGQSNNLRPSSSPVTSTATSSA